MALKVGSSPAGQQSALAHTGAVAGDDAVVSAFLADLNVIRVTSLEELLVTGALLGYARWPRRRMGVLTVSGGACDLIADRACAQGLDIPPFAAATVDAIAPHMPSFATVRNPLDATGYVLANSRTSVLTPVDHALDAAVGDPGLDLVLFAGLSLPDTRPPDERLAAALEARVAWVAQRIADSPVPVIPIGVTCTDVSPYARDVLGRNGLHLLGGIEFGLAAVGHAVRWRERQQRAAPDAVRMATPRRPPTVAGPWSEAAARDLLARAGVPVVPGELVTSADDAVRAAHRGRPAGRAEDLLGPDHPQVRHRRRGAEPAHRRARSGPPTTGSWPPRTRSPAPGWTACWSPPCAGGIELFAGVTVDPAFGPVLAVGLGGRLVEILADTACGCCRRPDEVARMLGELRARRCCTGCAAPRPRTSGRWPGCSRAGRRGAVARPPAADDGGEPLRVTGAQVEALDVLVVTGPPEPPRRMTCPAPC